MSVHPAAELLDNSTTTMDGWSARNAGAVSCLLRLLTREAHHFSQLIDFATIY